MPSIPYEIINHSNWNAKPGSPTPRQTGTLPVSQAELNRAAAIVGIQISSQGKYSKQSRNLRRWRVLMIQTFLHEDGSSWKLTPEFRNLDPSEKGSISYFLGMVQGYVFATKLAGYTHLVHLDILRKASGLNAKGTRPDFVAVDYSFKQGLQLLGTWEAKGRSRKADHDLLEKAKKQATKIPRLRGVGSSQSVGSVAHFPQSIWNALLEDPSHEGQELSIGIEEYLFAYYRPLVTAALEPGSEPRWTSNGDLESFLSIEEVRIVIPREIVNAFGINMSNAPTLGPTTELNEPSQPSEAIQNALRESGARLESEDMELQSEASPTLKMLRVASDLIAYDLGLSF